MYTRLVRSKRLVPAALGIITLAAVVVLLCSDALPRLFPAASHEILAAFSLATIALAYLIYQIAHRPPAMEFLKTILLAVAFLFWAANQFWPASPQATLLNDIAIALFVLDVFLVMIGWPKTPQDRSFGKTCSSLCSASCTASCSASHPEPTGHEKCCAGRAN